MKPVTVITGATGGIGSALAHVLEDHKLILLGRDANKLEKLCSSLPNALDAEERPNGIRVMGVYPGRTATAMQVKVRAQEGAEYEPETYTKPTTLAATIRTMLETPRDSILTQVIVSRMG
jgi:short-subunit dehydrogenase